MKEVFHEKMSFTVNIYFYGDTLVETVIWCIRYSGNAIEVSNESNRIGKDLLCANHDY